MIKNSKFTFHKLDNEKIIKEIRRLNKNKACQRSDIPITIIHENADIFADFLAECLEYVYMTPEVNSNRFEISNHFEKSFRLHDDFTAAACT